MALWLILVLGWIGYLKFWPIAFAARAFDSLARHQSRIAWEDWKTVKDGRSQVARSRIGRMVTPFHTLTLTEETLEIEGDIIRKYPRIEARVNPVSSAGVILLISLISIYAIRKLGNSGQRDRVPA
jgi:hypothetical protein